MRSSARPSGPSRALRATCVAVTAAAAALSLAACSGERSVGLRETGELRAATDDDVFAEPAEQRYRVVAVDLSSPELGLLGETASIRPEGSLVLSDGEITEARMSVSSGLHGSSIAFQLTEPLVLRRDIDSAEPVDAVGTLSIGGVEHHRTRMELIPSFSADGTAELDLEIPVPASLATSPLLGAGEVDSVRATVQLAVESGISENGTVKNGTSENDVATESAPDPSSAE